MLSTLFKSVFVVLLLSGGTAFAQLPEILVEEKPMNMSMGEQNGYELLVAGGEARDVESLMKKTFKSYKGKTSGSIKDELIFEGVTIKSISDSAFDIRVRMYNVGKDTKLMTFFDLWDGYLSTEKHPEQSKIATDILKDFGLRYQKVLVERNLKDQEKMASDLDKDLSGLIRDNEKMHKSIGESERDIQRSKKDISENELDQERKRAQIEAQKDVISKIQGGLGDEVKEADKTLKGLEKDLKKLENANEKMHTRIEDNQNEIKEAERNIEENLVAQKDKKTQIEAQAEVVKEVEKHLKEFPKYK